MHVRRCGFDFAERLYVNNLYPGQHVLPSAMLLHNIEWIADGAVRFMTMARGKVTPFFLYVGWTLPHNPEVLTSMQADPRYTPGGLWAANSSHVMASRKRACRLAKVSVKALLPRTGTGAQGAQGRQPIMMDEAIERAPRRGDRRRCRSSPMTLRLIRKQTSTAHVWRARGPPTPPSFQGPPRSHPQRLFRMTRMGLEQT
jgi:hypothetical protein